MCKLSRYIGAACMHCDDNNGCQQCAQGYERVLMRQQKYIIVKNHN